MKECTSCFARLPDRFFAVVNGRTIRRCTLCINADRRVSEPLAPIKRDPVQVQINNLVNLWFGPVSREPFRSHA